MFILIYLIDKSVPSTVDLPYKSSNRLYNNVLATVKSAGKKLHTQRKSVEST